MPTAHEDNSGLQFFSASQTSQQIEKALTDHNGEMEFQSEDFTTAPLTPPVEAPKLDAEGKPIAAAVDPTAVPVVDTAALPRRNKPGKHERQLARANSTIEEMRLQLAEMNGKISGLMTSAPRTETPAAAAVVPPVEQKSAAQTTPVVEVAKFDKPRPKREDFFDTTDPEVAYEDAVADWKLDSREFARTARAEADKRTEDVKKVEKAQQTAVDRWNSAITEARTELSDFDEVIKRPHFDAEKNPLPIVSAAMTHMARSRKAGAKILYWLGTHPEEANKIAVKSTIADVSDAFAVEEAMNEVRREFDRIEQDLTANPPKPAVNPKPGVSAVPPADQIDDDDDEGDDEELEVDPNLQPVSVDPAAGRKVEQPPAPGTVDTKPPVQPAAPAVAPKPEPVSRVGARGGSVNKAIAATPPDALRTLPPDDYRRRRALEGSTAARG